MPFYALLTLAKHPKHLKHAVNIRWPTAVLLDNSSSAVLGNGSGDVLVHGSGLGNGSADGSAVTNGRLPTGVDDVEKL